MNLPNTLTIARIFFVPLLVAVLVQERIILHWNGAVITNDVVALIIFWVAAATDILDGYLARRWRQVTARPDRRRAQVGRPPGRRSTSASKCGAPERH